MLLVLGISIGLIGCYLRTDYVPETPQPQPDGGPDGDPPIPPDCDDGDHRCTGEESYLATLEVCEDGEWTEVDCHALCRDEYGPEYVSWGCDAEADNPCQCEYDMIEGEMMWCDPAQIYCIDSFTVEICEYESITTQSCNDYCVEHFGPDYISWGCNDDAEDPCQCDLDIIGGEMMVCTPEDIICFDDDTMGVCENEWDYTRVECADYCVETFGSEYLSEGCDASADDPCQCVAPASGSGGSGE